MCTAAADLEIEEADRLRDEIGKQAADELGPPIGVGTGALYSTSFSERPIVRGCTV